MSLGSISLNMMSRIGKKEFNQMIDCTLDPMKYQKELLFNLLEENKNTEFGKANHFDEIKTIEDFQRMLPIRNYDDYAPYIERMANGETNILTVEPIEHFNRTSGTLGCEKKIPLTDKQINVFAKYNARICNYIFTRDMGNKWTKGKGFNICEGAYVRLPSGISYGCASSIQVAKMAKLSFMKDMLGALYSSPYEARVPSPGTLTRYIHARFALMEKNITYGIATFSSNFLETLRYIESNWEMLVKDIKHGCIDDSISLPDDVKKALLKKIKPLPKRALELREIFKQGFDEPIVPKLWPKFTYLQSCAGAGFAPYTEKLRKKYFGPNVKIVYFGISASEGFFSSTFEVEKEESLLVPDCCFMEFRDIDSDENKYLTMDQLEKNHCYEIFITNLSGLYRYEMKDVFRVVDFVNKSPLVRFECRAGYPINLFGEKTSETAIRQTMKMTEDELGISIYEDTVYGDLDNIPSRYVFLIEVDKMIDGVDKQKIRDTIEKNLKICNEDIVEEFELKHLAPTRLIILQKETNMLYRDLMVMKGSSASQLKPVKVIRNEFQRKFFFGLEDKEVQ